MGAKMPTLRSRTILLLSGPLDDYVAALHCCVAPLGGRGVAMVVLCAALSWWVYVPIHELAHALGCWVAGGEVTRLEIDAVYGAAWLREVFPFVTVGSEYAGQLTGFDTRGSDLTYLSTDFVPFLLTVFVGVPLLRSAAGDRRRPLRGAAKLGAALPIAYAPFISIPGDYYEMGSILVSRVYTLLDPAFVVGRWRSDDVFKLAESLFGGGGDGGAVDAAGVGCSLLLGVGLSLATYAAGALFAETILATAKDT